MNLSSRANYLQVIAVGVVAGWASCASVGWAEQPLQDAAQSEAAMAQPQPAADAIVASDLSQKTDTELTELTAQWSKLTPSERRRLLAEVRGRMAANRGARGNVAVQVQRRYGRVVRKSDGSVVVQTRVIQVRPRADAPASGRVTFGIGFEQRSKSRLAGPSPVRPGSNANSAPAVTVSQQPAADQTE